MSNTRFLLVTAACVSLIHPLAGMAADPPAKKTQTAEEMIAVLSKLPPGTPIEYESTFTTSQGGGRTVTEQAGAEGASGRAVGDEAANFKMANTQPPAAHTSGSGATGGDSDGEGAAKGGDRAEQMVRVLCALAGLIGLGGAVWILKRGGNWKDAALSGGVGVGLIAAAVYPLVLVFILGGAVLALLARFVPVVLKARAFEPARAMVGGVGAIEQRANSPQSDDAKQYTFASTREYLLAVAAAVKAEIQREQTGNDREITRELVRADNLP